jgi:hypothetical protein
MINQGNDVPENTIAVFLDAIELDFKAEDLHTIIDFPDKKRDWFKPNFYRCLPLTIANQYGFVLKSQYDIIVTWDGGDNNEAISFSFTEPIEEINRKFPRIASHFGSGVFTLDVPFTLRTPPGINLMTINTPNSILSNITVMTGVIESDNLRRNFTFNFKIEKPNVTTFIPKGSPLATIIPVPRYFVENFKLENAENIFSEELVIEEVQARTDAVIQRQELIKENPEYGIDRNYLNGIDVYQNKFPDHQGTVL